MLRTVVIILFLASGCEEQALRDHNRPGNDDPDVPGYEAETIQSVKATKSATITISKTTISIPEDGLGEDAEVRLRTLKSKPERDEVASLGDAKGDIIEVTMYNMTTDEIYASSLLEQPYTASQVLTDVSDEDDLKYVVISAPGTDDEVVQVLSRKALTTSAALTTTDLSVAIELGTTHAIFYAVESAEASGTVIILDSGKDTSNDSGGSVSTSSSSSSTSSSSSSTSGGASIDCSGIGHDPDNETWIGVPANADVGQDDDFCVMKWEAKNDGGNAVSKPAGTPWVDIRRGTDPTTASSAMKACADLGTGYTLITNVMWQTIARNIEANPDNWNDGAGPVGTGTIPRGHSNGSVAQAADVTGDPDDDPYLGTGFSGDWTHKRTHALSNDEVIWDLAGNVWEWVSDDITGTSLTPSLGPVWKEFTNTGLFDSAHVDNRLKFAPLGSYDSSQSMGQPYGGSGGAVLRGGTWNAGTYAGVFATNLAYGPSVSYYNIGFRCAWRPASEP